jgi:large subunit ribosomal protein L29
MSPSDVRKLSAEDLGKKEGELRERVARLTMKRNARRLDKPSELVAARRDLARVLTVKNEGGAKRAAQKEKKS